MEEHDTEAVDPRVKDQLECMNSYTDEINSLELQLDEANATFRNTLSEYSQILKQLAKRLGKCVQVARPYFEAEEISQKAKLKCEEAAIKYHRACGIYKEAKETIALTEAKFHANKEEYEFNAAWQEMLNRETKKLMNAETLKQQSEKEHERTTQIFAEAVQHVKVLEHKLKRDIAKSRLYFEQKKVFLRVLQDLKNRVESLQKAVVDSKASYATCLRNLEMISKEIHDRRRMMLPPREPGVGAEREVPPFSDLCIYPPLSDLHLTDTESENTESICSATDNDIPDDIKDMCTTAFRSLSAFNSPSHKPGIKQRTISEPCISSCNQDVDLSTNNNPDSDVWHSTVAFGDTLVSANVTLPSTELNLNVEDAFEDVDLSGD